MPEILDDHERRLYEKRLARHLAGGRFYVPNAPSLTTPLEYDARVVVVNDLAPIGHITVLPRHVIIHPRDVIRLDHPPGIAGELSASLEWINHTIALAAARARARIEKMHR